MAKRRLVSNGPMPSTVGQATISTGNKAPFSGSVIPGAEMASEALIKRQAMMQPQVGLSGRVRTPREQIEDQAFVKMARMARASQKMSGGSMESGYPSMADPAAVVASNEAAAAQRDLLPSGAEPVSYRSAPGGSMESIRDDWATHNANSNDVTGASGTGENQSQLPNFFNAVMARKVKIDPVTGKAYSA